MGGILGIISGILGAFTRIWDHFMSPKKQKERADTEVDKAIETHDEDKVNEILDRGLK